MYSLDTAHALVQAGDWTGAERACTALLQADPENPGALHLLGVVAARRGMTGQAIELIERAHRLGRPSTRSLNDLGMAYLAGGQPDDARRCFKKALAGRADDAEAHANLGRALKQLGKTVQAEECFRRAATLRPDFGYAWYWLGNLLREQGRLDAAEQCLRQANAADPRNAEFLNDLAIVLADSGRRREAEASFRSAIELSPDYLPARHNLGNVLKDLGRLSEAEGMYRSVLVRDPGAFATRVNLAGLLKDLERADEAIAEYQAVLAARPQLAEVHYSLGNAFYRDGRTLAAQESYRRALELDPHLGAARWEAAINQLPSVYGPDEDPLACREAFARSLRELSGWLDSHFMDAGDAATGLAPFNLAYQEHDNRALMIEYGAVMQKLIRQWPDRERLRPPATRPGGGLLRVGVVSKHIREHSVWNALVKGWVLNLDRSRFAVHLFHVGTRVDDETQRARAAVARFEEGHAGLREWADAILASGVDVLIYPEIGMDALTAKLASLRLAPIQAASWGHPESTGLPSIDFYLSAEELEAPGAADHYSERLVLLPGLGCCVDSTAAADAAPGTASVRADGAGPVLVCPGTPYKYAPQYDWVFPEIATRLGRCRFVFFDYITPAYTAKLRKRLSAAFAERGMALDDYCVFVPWQSRAGFHAILGETDVYLDTLGFSGFNTALHGIECALPIVTRDTRFLRGRLAAGILRRIGLETLIAPTTEGYVDLAVTLAQDDARRRDIRRVIERERHILYGDLRPIHALEDFLLGVAARSG